MQLLLDPANLETKPEVGILEGELLGTAEPAEEKAAAADIAWREGKVLALAVKEVLEEKKGLPAVHRMEPVGLLRNSFCISSKHFKITKSL